MEDVLNVAFYLFKRYNSKMHSVLDEMKLHKLLYFAQRESLVRTDDPLFEEQFEGWKYGPVCVLVRNKYHQGEFDRKENFINIEQKVSDYCKSVIKSVLEKYGNKDSWSLSDITHFEYSWMQSRQGIAEGVNGNNPILLDDIRKDAKRIYERRKELEQRSSKKCQHSKTPRIPFIDVTDLEDENEIINVAEQIKFIQKRMERRKVNSAKPKKNRDK